MELRIDHVHAVALDLNERILFYGKLGFRLLRKVAFGPADDRRRLAYVGRGDSVIELVGPRNPDNPGGGGTGERPFAMYVDDAEAVVTELEALGVEIDPRPRPGFSFDGKTAVIPDPRGLAIELREWAAHDGPTYPDWSPTRHAVVNLT